MPEAPLRPPIATAALSVILLVHNDAAELDEVVTAWVNLLKGLERSFEIILVEDASTDGSATLADKLAEQFASLRVVHPVPCQGQGAALRTGLAQAQHPLLFYTLGNKQYQPADLPKLLAMIDQVDLVTGFRVWRPLPWWLRAWDVLFRGFKRVIFGLPSEPRPCWLGWSGLGRRLLARWVFGVHVYDPECAYRLFRRKVMWRLFLQSSGPFAHIEFLAKANFLECWMAEVPVTFLPAKPAPSFAGEAYHLFRHPDFGPVQVSPFEEIPALPEPSPPEIDGPCREEEIRAPNL
jgi:glycosyltransferase involved in cell wall biosynthesis